MKRSLTGRFGLCARMLPDLRCFVDRLRAAVLVAVVCAAGSLHAQDEIARTGGPYVPTPQEVVDRMLEFAQVGKDDFVVDLGSGDGRMVLTAARRYGARGLGVDIDPELVEQANEQARKLGVADRVTFRVEDVRLTRVNEASVVTLYLLPGMMKELQSRLLTDLKPGSRIVSHDFDFNDWKPDQQIMVDVKEKYGNVGNWKSTLYLWRIPSRVAGAWQITVAGEREPQTVQLDQRFQELSGALVVRGRKQELAGGRVDGDNVEFRLRNGATYRGVIADDALRGTILSRGKETGFTAARAVAVTGSH